MGRILLTREYAKRDDAYRVPGAHYDPKMGGMVFDPTAHPEGIMIASKLFPLVYEQLKPYMESGDGQYLPSVTDYATEIFGTTHDSEARKNLLPHVDSELRKKLYDYQVTDIAFSVARIQKDGGAYIGWSRGLGKTVGAIGVMQQLQAKRTLIVCPNSSKESVWRAEFEKWMPGIPVFNIGGTKKQRFRMLDYWKGYTSRDESGSARPGVALIHYEALRLIDWSDYDIDFVVVDEAHRLANGSPRGKSSPAFYKALLKIKTPARLALSGSIIVNSPEDFFGANAWLLPTYYKAKWKDWNNRFLSYVPGTYDLIGVNPVSLPQMRDELGSFMVIRRKEDELPGLPDKLEKKIRVPLLPEQRKAYDEFADRMLAELESGEIVMSASTIAQLSKLRQIATGLDLVSDKVEASSKLDLAVEMVQDNLPNKTVIFAWHRATCNAMQSRLQSLGVECGLVHGDVKPADRAEAVDRFQDPNDSMKVIVATIKTLGESVTLHTASDLIFLESSWTSTDMEQAADRVHRIGQSRRVSITHLLADDTVDVHNILPTVESKAQMRELIFGGQL